MARPPPPTPNSGTWPPATITFPADLTMLGLRDVVVLAPSPSLHHHQQPASYHHPNIPFPSSATLGVGIFPFLAAAPPEEAKGPGGGEKTSTSACEDCGNRAKRDCSFGRCRTCCKSRGYDCSTHLKSTWVPAAVRRERQVMRSSTGSSSKRPRMAESATSASHASTCNNSAPRSFSAASYHQDEGFKATLPGEVMAPAVLRSAMNQGKSEFGYQATVTISGHVFKGFLHDQGLALDDKNVLELLPNLDPSDAIVPPELLLKGDGCDV